MRRLAPWLMAAALLGCGEEVSLPGLTVAVVTDATTEFDTVVVEASRGSDDYNTTFTADQLPGTIFLGCDESLGPRFCDDRTIDVRVVGRQGATQERIVRTAQLVYDAGGTNRLLHMPLCASCLDVDCAEGQTCVRGACIDPSLDVMGLAVDDPSLPLDDGECARVKCTGTCGDGCGTCPDHPTVSLTGGPTSFDIDTHEVTRDAYAAFLEADVTLDGQDEVCAWNRDFAPETDPDPDRTGCMESEQVCQGDGCGSHPQVCIDWCDAVAYCRWRGKRLCGARGGGGVATDMEDEAAVSQWFAACSAEATAAFPYGDTHVEQQCNDGAANLDTTAPVGASPDCVTASGIFDLSGNVAEWTDSCSENGSKPRFQNCAIRGGSYVSDANVLSCALGDDGNTITTRDREDVSPTVGFRCCSP